MQPHVGAIAVTVLHLIGVEIRGVESAEFRMIAVVLLAATTFMALVFFTLLLVAGGGGSTTVGAQFSAGDFGAWHLMASRLRS
jgi:hypothetical protein